MKLLVLKLIKIRAIHQILTKYKDAKIQNQKKEKKRKKMADKERTATAAFLPRGLGKGEAKGRHSSAQSQVSCNPENPGSFPSLLEDS